MTRPSLKVVADPTLDGPREELRLAILDVEQAEASTAKSRAASDRAADHLRAMELTHVRAEVALEEARAGQRPLAEQLAAACDDDDRFRIVAEHNASTGRPAITADDLRKLRQEVESAADEVVAARSAFDLAQDQARPTTSALSRARARRQRAIYEVSRPEIDRLLREAQDLTERLAATRGALKYVAWNLLDPYSHGDDQLRVESFLSRPPHPEESGLRSENDPTRRNAALAGWAQFAEAINKDANAPFPGSH
jgi:hypothetical protein